MTEHMALIVWGQNTWNLDSSTKISTMILLCEQTSTIMFSIFGSDLDLWADVIQLAVTQSPQHMLCCITTHPKIEGMERREQLSPYLQTNQQQQSTHMLKACIDVYENKTSYRTRHSKVCNLCFTPNWCMS